MRPVPRPVRRLAAAGLLAAVAAVPGASGASAVAGGGAETIRQYDVQISLREDASMHVRETIEYDFGSARRRGIYRNIPVEFPYDEDHRRVYPIDNLRVASPSGAPADVEVQEGAQYVLRIGDPDRTVTGMHTYVISYDVGSVVNSFAGHQELYWNAIGTEWQVLIDRATVTVEGPAEVAAVACYEGASGSTQQCRSAIGDNGEGRFAAAGLHPNQGMTVVASFPAGTFPRAAPQLEEYWRFDRAFSIAPLRLLAALGALGLLGGWAIAMVVRRGRDEQYLGVTPGLAPGVGQQHRVARVPWLGRDPVAVQFTPPEGLRAGQVGTLLDEQANVVDVTATLVDLAVRGLLRIEEVEKRGWFGKGDWRLVQLREPRSGELHDYETALFNSIFSGRQQVLLSELKQTFRAELAKVQGLLYDDVTRRGWFRGNPSSVRLRWQVGGVLLLMAGAGLTWLLAAFTSFGLVGVAVVIAGIVLLIVAPRMPARTAAGTATLAQARGFRLYLETAEAEQIRFEEGEDIFSRYLPFAIVFGVAERWAEVFARLAASGAAVATPTWYTGAHYAPGLFDYSGFGRSLDSFATTAEGSLAAATPSSSGSSGFGGGGFSGGGGGGGGGGSW